MRLRNGMRRRSVSLVCLFHNDNGPMLSIGMAIPVADGPVRERKHGPIGICDAIDAREVLEWPMFFRELAIDAAEMDPDTVVAVNARIGFAVNVPMVALVNGNGLTADSFAQRFPLKDKRAVWPFSDGRSAPAGKD